MVQLNRNLERAETGHIIGLHAALAGLPSGRSLLERIVDGVAGQRSAGLHIDLRSCDVLAHQRIKHALVSNQIRAEARSLIVFRHRNGNNLAVAVHRHLDLERRKTGHIVAVGGRFNSRILALVAAVDSSRFGKNRVLITRMRLNAERVLRIGQHFLHRVHKRAGRNSCACKRIHIVAQCIRIGRNPDELLLESVIAHAAAQALRLLKGTDVNLSRITIHTHAERNRNLSAVALRIRGQRIALDAAVSVLADEDFIQHAVVRNAFILNLLVFAARKNRVQSGHLGSQLLSLDRALGDFVGDGQQHGGNKRKDEQTERKLHNITHYFLTSPKLLLPVTRSISGEQTFISRMA